MKMTLIISNCERIAVVVGLLMFSACGPSKVIHPTMLPKIPVVPTKKQIVVSEVQYDVRVVPPNVTSFMECVSRETFSQLQKSGFLPDTILERDAISRDAKTKRYLIRYRVNDFKEIIDGNAMCPNDNTIEILVQMKFYDVTGVKLHKTSTVEASVTYESNMFDTTAIKPLFMTEYHLLAKGKVSMGDKGSERIAYSRAMASELATQLVIKTAEALHARWPK
ncbi:MAG: hypothetical protein JW841_12030 [Deltaproteobacteria bacterium]|nr:hypothetical protein [Deltaproteobacteria bacterium]